MALSRNLRWSHIYFICIPTVDIISFCISILSRVDELNKFAGLQCTCMGLHTCSLAGRALQHKHSSRPQAQIPLKPRKTFFGLFHIYKCVNYDSLRWSHTVIHFICIPAVHIISFCVSLLSRINELNKLAGLQCMALHSSAGRALQRECRSHGFESR